MADPVVFGHYAILGFSNVSGDMQTSMTLQSAVVRVRLCGDSVFYDGYIFVWYNVGDGWVEVTDSSHMVGWRNDANTWVWRSFEIPNATWKKLNLLRIKFDTKDFYAEDVQFKINRIIVACEYTCNSSLFASVDPSSGNSPLISIFSPIVIDGGGSKEHIMWDGGEGYNAYNGSEVIVPSDLDGTHTYESSGTYPISGHYSSFIDIFPVWAHSVPTDITVAGMSAGPQLRYPLDNLIFDEGVSQLPLIIYNDGDADLTISLIARSSTGIFALWDEYSVPIVIAGGASYTIYLDYVYAGDFSIFSTLFTVFSDDPSYPEATFTASTVFTTSSETIMRHLKYFSGGIFKGCLLTTRSGR